MLVFFRFENFLIDLYKICSEIITSNELMVFFSDIPNCYDELISGKKVRCKNIFYYTARQCDEHNKCRCVISKTGTTIPGLTSVPMRFKCKSNNVVN